MEFSRFTVHDAPQGTPEWLQARVGYVTGSRADAVCASKKDGKAWSARASYITDIVLERMTGERSEDIAVTPWMARGKALEADARAALEIKLNTLILECGFLQSKTIPLVGCSIDGYTAEGQIVELKVPKPKTHLKYLADPMAFVSTYLMQCSHNLLVTGAPLCYLASFCPSLPPSMRLIVEEIHAGLAETYYTTYLTPFLEDVDEEMRKWAQFQLAVIAQEA